MCLVALLLIVTVGCGSSKPRRPSHAPVRYDAPIKVSPPKPAPSVVLRNYDGRVVNLATLRGKAVLVTFVFTHCPDTCPLIISNLRAAQALLGSRKQRVQMVAISTDPAQDTPATVRRFLARRGMLGRMDYLLGNRRALQRVWSAWGVSAKRVSSTPAAVEHSAMVFGIGAHGNVRTLYPANFKPQWIAHDVPLLASQ